MMNGAWHKARGSLQRARAPEVGRRGAAERRSGHDTKVRAQRATTSAGAGGARVSGVQRAPRMPAPQCWAGARHARPAPLPRRLTAWPTRAPPRHAPATLSRRYASIRECSSRRGCESRRGRRHRVAFPSDRRVRDAPVGLRIVQWQCTRYYMFCV